jgi:hypothetical protein
MTHTWHWGDTATALIFLGIAVAADALYGSALVADPLPERAAFLAVFGLLPTVLLSWAIVARLVGWNDADDCRC